MSYKKLSPSLCAFITNLSHEEISKNIQEAMMVPQWKADVLEEMRALKKMEHGRLLMYPTKKDQWVQVGLYDEIQLSW